MSKKSKYGLSIFSALIIILIALSLTFKNAQDNSVKVTSISGDEKELDNINLVNSNISSRMFSDRTEDKDIKSRSYLISSKNSEKLNLNKDKNNSLYLSSKTKKYIPLENDSTGVYSDSYISNDNDELLINFYDRDFKEALYNYDDNLFKFKLKKDSDLYKYIKKDSNTSVYNIGHNNKKYCIVVVDNENEFRDKQEKDLANKSSTEGKKYKYNGKIFVLEMNFKDKNYKEISSVDISDEFNEMPSIGYVSAFDKIIVSIESKYKGKYFIFDTEKNTVVPQNIENLPKSNDDNRPISVLSIVEGNFPYYDKKDNKLNIIHTDIKNGSIVIFKYILEDNQLKFSEKVDTKIPMINDTYAISKDNKVIKTDINRQNMDEDSTQTPYMISVSSDMPNYYLLLNQSKNDKIIFFKVVSIDIFKNMNHKSTENINYGYQNLGSNPALEINIYDKKANKVVYQGLIDGPVRSNLFDFILCDVEDINK